MAKRKDSPQTSPTDATSDKVETSSPQPAAPLASVESPALVPQAAAETAAAAGATASTDNETASANVAPVAMRVDLPSAAQTSPAQPSPASPAPGEVVTVSFAQAAADAAALRGPAERKQAAIAAYLRTRRFMALAATAAVAAAVGAMTGALATSGVTRLLADEQPTRSVALDDSRLLKDTIAQLGAEIGALRHQIDASAKSAGTQFSRLSERLDRADRQQAESTGKLAKLTETLDRRNATAAAAPALSSPQASAHASADPVATGSIPASAPQITAPATRPAGQPIVQGWTLRNVYNGAAIIQGRIGLVEVEPGDTIPGLGRIENIRRQDGRWVVVTNRGLIIAR